jgi:hypothetical protein
MSDAPATHDIIDGRSAFHDAIRAAFDAAAQHGCREIRCVDRDFADWPLSERYVVDRLTTWTFAHRRLLLLAQTFDEFPRRHARWAAWRVARSHVVHCAQVHEDDARDMPCLLLAPGLVAVQLHDREHYRGRVYRNAADWVALRELTDALEQRSSAAFAATTLGL